MDSFETVDLITLSGGEIHIEIPTDIADEVFLDLRTCWEHGGIWFVGNWEEVIVNYFGKNLNEIDMKHIVGTK